MIGRRLGNLLIAAGLVLMAWPGATWVYGLYWQERLARSFPAAPVNTGAAVVDVKPSVRRGASPVPKRASAETKRAKTKQAGRPRPAPRAGAPLARLRIDRIGLDAVVIEGVDGVALRRGPGHLPNTGLPGESRNCAIAAHRDGWFLRLPEVRVGDPVRVETLDGAYEFVVSGKKVVTPDRSDLLNRGRKPGLTLITCTGPGYPRSAYRLLVFCDLRDGSASKSAKAEAEPSSGAESFVFPALLRTKLAQQQAGRSGSAAAPVKVRPAAARPAARKKAPKARVLVAARPAVSPRPRSLQKPPPRERRARAIARAAAPKGAEKPAASVPKAPPTPPPPSPVVEPPPDPDTSGIGEPTGDGQRGEGPVDGGEGPQQEPLPEPGD